jgi:hypothetical protein
VSAAHLNPGSKININRVNCLKQKCPEMAGFGHVSIVEGRISGSSFALFSRHLDSHDQRSPFPGAVV